ncbi:uncharacterized protein LOC105843431 [Hydra vulgaris]|uniref:uncharacterized protein LOC105843431 n=1 Tax=Hydra vulgaris TaxID=6087 RepID=UPI000641855B|nr:uncharacterized protein LOC105843431 [Hydra vulgaris]
MLNRIGKSSKDQMVVSTLTCHLKTITAICIVNPEPHTCSDIVRRSLKRRSKRKKKNISKLHKTFDQAFDGALQVINTRTRLRNMFSSTFLKWSNTFRSIKRQQVRDSSLKNNTAVKEELIKNKADSSLELSCSSVESYKDSNSESSELSDNSESSEQFDNSESSEQSDNPESSEQSDNTETDGVTFALTQKFIGWRV